MTKTICGIDPGLSGAIAFKTEDRVGVLDMPIFTKIVRKRGGKSTISKKNPKGRMIDQVVPTHVNSDELAELLDKVKPHVCYLEQVASMPGQGVASTFKFGRSFGAVEGVLEALRIPIVYVRPSIWKKDLGLDDDKDKSLDLASKLFPNNVDDWPLKKHNGRAEAALIAYWGSKHGEIK